jgi:hypothetical protein
MHSRFEDLIFRMLHVYAKGEERRIGRNGRPLWIL